MNRVTQELGHAVPLLRYFTWVGSLLIALLFFANWYWPDAAPPPAKQEAAEAPTNSLVLRIQSDRKLPDKVVLDTSIPTIVPPVPGPIKAPAAPALVDNATSAQQLDARAEMNSDGHAEAKHGGAAASSAPKRSERMARAHHRSVVRTAISRPAFSTWASAYPMGPPMWSFRW